MTEQPLLPYPMNREAWLYEMAALMAPRFAEMGYPLPKFRVSIGWPSVGKDGGASGECWHNSVSNDGHFEIFLNPSRDDALAVAATFAHELIHAAVGFDHGHKGEFARLALAFGFARPLTHASKVTPEPLAAWLAPLIGQVGALPHAALAYQRGGGASVKRGAAGIVRPSPSGDDSEGGEGDAPAANNRPPKQSTRLLKATCLECDKETGADCGYTARITRKWVGKLGAPHCPAHG